MEETPWAETNQHSQARGEVCSNYFWFHSLPELPDICNRTTFKLVWQNLITSGLDTANHLAFVQARGLIFLGSECTRQFVKEAIPLQDNLSGGRKWTAALWLQFPSFPSNHFLTLLLFLTFFPCVRNICFSGAASCSSRFELQIKI